MKIIRHIVSGAIILILTLSLSGCAPFRQPQPSEVFDQAVSFIEKNYIDQDRKRVKLDTSKRPDIRSLLTQMNSRMQIISVAETARDRERRRGIVGLHLGRKDNAYKILKVFDSHAAKQEGLCRGDTVLEIDGAPIEKMSPSDVLSKLRGIPGTEVAMKIARGNETMTITRTRMREYKVSYVAQRRIDDEIGYLRIASFEGETVGEVRKDMQSLLAEDVQGLVLDIRSNGGGLFQTVLDTAELFLNKEETIGTLVGGEDSETAYTAEGRQHNTKIPLVVLIDGNTAVGAEVFAAALKDNKRARLVGEKSQGVGDIRTVYPLGDGSLIIIRTGYLLRKSGEPIEGRGVMPDRVIVLSDKDKEALYDRIDVLTNDNLADISTDIQLKAAVEIIKEEIGRRK